MRLAVAITLAVALWAGTTAHVGAATSQDDIDEAKRVQQLEEAKKAAAEARKATAEAEAAEAKAKLGTLDTSKLTKPTADAKTLNIEGTILAYGAVEGIAVTIAKAVIPKPSSAGANALTIVLLGEKESNALRQAHSFAESVNLLNAAMTKFTVPSLAADDMECKQPGTGGAGLGLLGSIDVALQIAQLFKVDKKFEGADVSIDDFALASSVMSKLTASGARVVYGPAYVANAFGGTDQSKGSKIATGLNDLGDGQNNVDVQVAEIARRRDKLKDREDDQKVKLPDSCKKPFDQAKQIYTALETKGKNLKDRAEKLLTAATTVDEKTGATLLQSLMQAEAMGNNVSGADVLRLKAIAGGGTTYTRTNLFSARIGIGGGAVVAYMLIDPNGTVKVSGTATEYGGFVHPEELGAFLASRRVDSTQAAGASKP